MSKPCIKLYATGTATADSVASIIVPQSGKVVALDWSGTHITAAASGGATIFQLSQQSTSQFALNDARGIVGEFVCGSPSAAVVAGADNKYTSISGGIEVKAGDKLYLHRQAITAFGTLAVNVNVICQ